MPSFRQIKRLMLVSALACALLGATMIATSFAGIQNQINSGKSTAASLQAQINAETAQIEKTSGGVAAAQSQLASIESQVYQREAQLRSVQQRLMRARDRLLALEDRLHIAANYLAANLRSQYEQGTPSLVDVVLNANGFSNLLSQISYLKDAQNSDAAIVKVTQIVRARVQREALSLGSLEQRDRNLTDQILAQRNQEATIEAALVKQQIDEQTARASTKGRLAGVEAHVASLQKKYAAIQAAAARAAAESAAKASEQVNQQAGGIAVDTGSMVQAPPGAPQAVQEMIAAGNAIATLPYIWGGGHASFQALGYDCSGSVSFVLNAAGLLSSPEVSGWFESYGDPGPGQWVTIYANAGHVWMEIAGWRFDTVALAETGTRWARGGGEFAGFVVRHPPGL
jgi:peptidoglycan hydrolase CwlO-like protein